MALPIPLILGVGILAVALVKGVGSSTKGAASDIVPPSPPSPPSPDGGGGGTIPGASDPTAGYVVVPIESVSKSAARPTREELVMLMPGRVVLAFIAIMRNEEPTKVVLGRFAVTERAIGDLSGEDDVKGKFLGADSTSPISFKEGDRLPKEGTTFPIAARQILHVEKGTSASGLSGRTAFWRTRR